MTLSIPNYLTIDVEDYFQVAAFERVIREDAWPQFESRVEANTHRVLELLADHQVRGTFFVVGWTAERYPALIRHIADQGHEIACHSYRHQKVYTLTPEAFRQDTQRAKTVLEDISGKPVVGYRAPTYSITARSLWALDILEELGFQWDSSIFPIIHDNYGIPDAPRFEYPLPGHNLMEYPISTALFFGRKIPVAGGGYFRIFPYWFSRMALGRINSQEKKPFIFYLHPWEFDPQQPRIARAGWKSRFRHYLNLDKTEGRFERLLSTFRFRPISAHYCA
ncbi:XrtA system polysaccharide deacetylase [Desulfogranum mediterraneum]|uniref:XrtA system polysaccharide deacetylase n=1 Tax=Desulfogranum mediterraneum TaxID=160661 RepID=UPI000422F0E5|nr:XrtA system polysaccharide deacetylase [Desulfogranum mediterraneum]